MDKIQMKDVIDFYEGELRYSQLLDKEKHGELSDSEYKEFAVLKGSFEELVEYLFNYLEENLVDFHKDILEKHFIRLGKLLEDNRDENQDLFFQEISRFYEETSEELKDFCERELNEWAFSVLIKRLSGCLNGNPHEVIVSCVELQEDLKTASTRVDKILIIDKFFHLAHCTGYECGFFIEDFDVKILDELSGMERADLWENRMEEFERMKAEGSEGGNLYGWISFLQMIKNIIDYPFNLSNTTQKEPYTELGGFLGEKIKQECRELNIKV